MLLIFWFALDGIFLSFASGFDVKTSIPIEKDIAKSLLAKGEMDKKTVVTFSIKAYVTQEVTATYQNYTESIEYLIDILNRQYKRSQIPIQAKLHCIEKTDKSESEGMNGLHVFEKSKRSVRDLTGSADLAVLFVTRLFDANGTEHGGQGQGTPGFGSIDRISACSIYHSLRSRIVLGHELGHNFGAMHHDGFHFRAGGRELGTLMNSQEKAGHCCNDEHGFYRFDIDKRYCF